MNPLISPSSYTGVLDERSVAQWEERLGRLAEHPVACVQSGRRWRHDPEPEGDMSLVSDDCRLRARNVALFVR
jgi:hypothetical protein